MRFGTGHMAARGGGRSRGSVVSAYRGASVQMNGNEIAVGGPPDALITEEYASGTNGGSTSATTWHLRTLNTIIWCSTVEEDVALLTLAAGQFTLPPGRYIATGWSSMYSVAQCRSGIYNVTLSAWAAMGINLGAAAAAGATALCAVMGLLTVADVANVFELRAYATNAVVDVGLGNPMSLAGINEVYAALEIRRVE